MGEITFLVEALATELCFGSLTVVFIKGGGLMGAAFFFEGATF